jgi:hypothetical protein
MDIDLSNYKTTFIESTENVDFGWEGEEQVAAFLKTNDWNSPQLFQSADAIFYCLPPHVFRVLSLKFISHDMASRIENDRAVDAIVLALLENKLLFNEFQNSEIHFIQRWIGKLMYADDFLLSTDKGKTLQFFSNLFEAFQARRA